MKQIIPFTKDITFKTKIGELTSISLDNDLTLKGEDLITGNFYIKGSYKMIKTSEAEEEYSYKIPCDIAISDTYDTFLATIDIDDFNYEIIDDQILRVNISLVIDNLEKKEIFEDNKEDVRSDEKEEEVIIDRKIDDDNFQSVFNGEETYSTYSIYVMKEEDTIEKILEKYNITRFDLEDYNDLTNVTVGSKIIIPSNSDE